MKRLALTLITSSVLMTSTVFGAGYKDGFKVREAKNTEESNKDWTISFSHELDSSLAISDNIYITDSENKKIETKVEVLSDKSKVKISPLNKYQLGKEYRLYIEDNLKMLDKNIYLKRAEVMSFKFISSNQGDHIKDIQVDYNKVASNILVTGGDEVFEVFINGVEAHYEGSNTYSLGIAALGEKAKIEIKAYDDKNNLLETKMHQL